MKPGLPHPWLSAVLLLCWIVLQGHLTLGNLLFGIILSVLLGRLWARLDPPDIRIRTVVPLIALAARVGVDVIRSNLAVARLILGRRTPDATFVHIDLALSSPAGLAVLACIITATPGTIWVQHDSRLQRLTIHVLDRRTVAAMVHNIKHRYEPALREVFP